MDTESIRHFAIDVLGCGCDQSVFNSIEVTDNPALACGVQLSKKILIGKRLLIYIADAGCCVPGEVEAVVRDGLIERNINGYNRLRLVIVTPDTVRLSKVYADAFGKLTDMDDKCHIHVVKPEDSVQGKYCS